MPKNSVADMFFQLDDGIVGDLNRDYHVTTVPRLPPSEQWARLID